MGVADGFDQGFRNRTGNGHWARHDRGLKSLSDVSDDVGCICAVEGKWFVDRDDGNGGRKRVRNEEDGEQNRFHKGIIGVVRGRKQEKRE